MRGRLRPICKRSMSIDGAIANGTLLLIWLVVVYLFAYSFAG